MKHFKLIFTYALFITLSFFGCQNKGDNTPQQFKAQFTELQNKHELLGEEILKKRYQIYLLEVLFESPLAPRVGDNGLWQNPDFSALYKTECEKLYSEIIQKCKDTNQYSFNYCRLFANMAQHWCENKEEYEGWRIKHKDQLNLQHSAATKDSPEIIKSYKDLIDQEEKIIEIFNSEKTSPSEKIKQTKNTLKSLKKKNFIMIL